jgi:hypothetical protein
MHRLFVPDPFEKATLFPSAVRPQTNPGRGRDGTANVAAFPQHLRGFMLQKSANRSRRTATTKLYQDITMVYRVSVRISRCFYAAAILQHEPAT